MPNLTATDIESLTVIARAQLAVCSAAKAERLNALSLSHVDKTGQPFNKALERWSKSCRETERAVDALIEIEARGD